VNGLGQEKVVKISASALRDYNFCPRKVYYRINKVYRPPSASQLFGAVVHDLIEEYETNGAVDIDLYRVRLAKEISKADVTFKRWQTSNALWKLLDECFGNYLILREQLPSLSEAEVGFSFEIRDGVKAVGRWDQIRGSNTIVELKTSHWPPSDIFLAADIQTTFYIWAFRELFHVMPKFYHVHLPTGRAYELQREDFTSLDNNIDAFIKDIKAGTLIKTMDGFKCSNCDYRDICIDTNRNNTLFAEAKYKQKKVETKNKFFLG